jgi:DNA topoisomerase-1
MIATKLHHTSDSKPGLTRRLVGKELVFYDQHGRQITSSRTIARCQKLGVPPAYTEVWISPDPHGHLQATVRDKSGRKQYIYHPAWSTHRNAVKYRQLHFFAGVLVNIRRHVAHDLALRGLPKTKVVATVIKLLDTIYARVGNEEYARENKSYGLTTLCDRHLRGYGAGMKFAFRGKSGVVQEIPIEDHRIRKIVAKCQDLPGQDLFEYISPGGDIHGVRSDDVNGYLRTVTGAEITAKDFRTWHGTVLACAYLTKADRGDTAAERKRTLKAAVDHAAAALGNTPAVCRRAYIHPQVLEQFLKGTLHPQKHLRGLRRRYPGLHTDELQLVSLLEKW